MKYEFIHSNKEESGLRYLCKLMGVTTSQYYNYCSVTTSIIEKRSAIYDLIKYIRYTSNYSMGYRTMKIMLARYGCKLSFNTVRKYMNTIYNVEEICSKRKTEKKHKVFSNLLKQDFKVDRPNKVWCIDFTYMESPKGRNRYNCTVIDLYDRSVVSSANSVYLDTNLAKWTVARALHLRNNPKGVILHSDQGGQFTSLDFTDFCAINGIRQSMSAPGYPYDNAVMERFYNSFKNEFYNNTLFSDEEAMDEAIGQYIHYYNSTRPHRYNNYYAPLEARC